MSGSPNDAAEPPRRRRRASRRAAGPPVSVSTPAASELTDDHDEPAATAVPAGRSPRHAAAEPNGVDEAAGPRTENPDREAVPGMAARTALDPTLGAEDTTADVRAAVDPQAGGSTEAGPAVVEPVHSHGSPGDAPGHQPVHPAGQGHSAQGHGPGQSAPQARDRSGSALGGAAGTGGEASRRSGRSAREEASERSLRSLVTTRSTQVSSTAALRAREVALPSVAELAAAEADLVIVRRHYVPPTTLTAGRRQDWPNR